MKQTKATVRYRLNKNNWHFNSAKVDLASKKNLTQLLDEILSEQRDHLSIEGTLFPGMRPIKIFFSRTETLNWSL